MHIEVLNGNPSPRTPGYKAKQEQEHVLLLSDHFRCGGWGLGARIITRGMYVCVCMVSFTLFVNKPGLRDHMQRNGIIQVNIISLSIECTHLSILHVLFNKNNVNLDR